MDKIEFDSVQKIINQIKNKGFLTGSCALGFNIAGSDIDYVLTTDDYKNIIEQLKFVGINIKHKQNYNDNGSDHEGCYFLFDGQEYNLIGLTENYANYWYQTICWMKSLPCNLRLMLIDKDKRKAVYCRMVDTFRYLSE